jgi:hypothetical protein
MIYNTSTLTDRIATLHEHSHFQTLFDGKGIQRGALAKQLPTDTTQSLKDLLEVFDILTQYVTPFEQFSTDWYPVIEYLCGQTLHDDGCGNRYVRIGDTPSVMFTSHVDTVGEMFSMIIKSFDGQYISTDGRTILGADDKAGVSAMIMMIHQGVQGLYYFFDGEECSNISSQQGVGSKVVVQKLDHHEQFVDMKYCISLDRKKDNDIITHQKYGRCCSDIFANSLSDVLASQGVLLHPSREGIYTDSANFVGMISECTNLSVGYHGAHTRNETQDILFLYNLTNALMRADFSRLQSAPFEY